MFIHEGEKINSHEGEKLVMSSSSSSSTSVDPSVFRSVKDFNLTQDQITEFREVFELFDREKEGFIFFSDVGTIMRSLGSNPTEAQINYIFQLLCQRAIHFGHQPDLRCREDLLLDFDSFLFILARHFIRDNENDDYADELREALNVLDSDGSGMITFQEFRKFMQRIGETVTDGDIDEMMRESSRDLTDEKISIDEVIKMML